MSRFPRFLILFLTLSLLFAACRPQTADRRPQADGGQPTVSSPAPTLTPSPAPTFTPTPEPTPTPIPLSPEFLSQFEGTAYTFQEGEILFSPSAGGTSEGQTPFPSVIARVENGKFAFTVGGKEVAVDPARVEILGKEWFLNGEEEQVIAVKDESGSWWQYEFDRQSGAWVEKSLPEVSTDVMHPTRLEWNDMIGGRWAVAVRQAIKEGKIPTFDPSKLKDVRFELSRDEFFKRYGMRFAYPKLGAPDYLDLRRPGSFPIIYSAYGVMEVEGGEIGILTEQVAIDKNGDFVLFNLSASPEDIQYMTIYGRRGGDDNAKAYYSPAVELDERACNLITGPDPEVKLAKKLCGWEQAITRLDIVREAVRKWANGEIFKPVFERLFFMVSATAYGD
jgi:hypothetical protein